MGKKKKRKEEAAKPDPFMEASIKGVEYARKNLFLVIVTIVAILGGGAFALAWPQMQKQKEIEAVDKLLAGRKLLEVPGANQFGGMNLFGITEPPLDKLEEAADIFMEVADEYPTTDAGRRALLEAGDTHMKIAKQKKGDEAVQHADLARDAYERVRSRGSAQEQFYALAGLGASQEFREDWHAAEKAYRGIVDNGRLPFRDVATLDLARVLVMQEKYVMAKDLLEGFETEFPSSSLKDQAESRLVMVSGVDGAADDGAAPDPTPAPEAGEEANGAEEES